MIYKYFLSFSRLPFHFVDGFLCCTEAFSFDIVPLVYFCFCCFCFWCQTQKIITKAYVEEFITYVSSRSFMFLGLMFKSLIHFELNFLHGVREWFSFIVLHVAVQFFPTPFFEETILAALYILDSFVTN